MESGWSSAESEARLELLAGAHARRLPGAAVLKLTSGTTGEPAGIAVPAEALLADHAQLEASMGLLPEDRFLVVVPMSHSYGFSLLPSASFRHASVLVFPQERDPKRVAGEHEVSVVPSVPSWYRARLTLGVADWPRTTRLFLSAGAPLSAELARAWREQSARAIHVLYGSSECGGISYDRRGDAAERGTVGEAVEGVRIHLQTEGAEVGRVVVHSAAVAEGYVPQSKAARERLSGGCFRTGDLGRRQDGELVLLGRIDDWINVKGKKVNPREVEEILARMPGVREVVVLGVSLPEGRGEAVHAIVACAEGELRYQAVLDWCRDRLAPHKVPRGIRFTNEIPRTGRGKPDRGALLALTSSSGDVPS
jgi:acyl-coenzyme A synthetase/AMP-(fatty) acid ligase